MFIAFVLLVIAWLVTGGLAFALFRLLFLMKLCKRCNAAFTYSVLCSKCAEDWALSQSNRNTTQPNGKQPFQHSTLDGEKNAQSHQALTVEHAGLNLSTDISATIRLIQFARSQGWLDPSIRRTLFSFLKGVRRSNESPHATTQKQTTVAEIDNSVLDASMVGEPAIAVGPDQKTVIDVNGEDIVAAEIASEIAAEIAVEIIEASPEHPPVRDDNLSGIEAPVKKRVQQTTANLLESFMRSANIRWIEIISAALVVICSVGLVVSLWSTLSAANRFFPSLVFATATIAVHGAGQYTLKKWKLRDTSRGILHIGLMLIPLAILTSILIVRKSNAPVSLDVWSCCAILCGASIYFGLAISASRALFGRIGTSLGVFVSIASTSLLAVFYLPSFSQFEYMGLLTLSPGLVAAGAMGLIALRESPSQFSPRTRHRYSAFKLHCTFGLAVLFAFAWHQFSQIGSLRADWWAAAIAALSILMAWNYEQWERSRSALLSLYQQNELTVKQSRRKKQQSIDSLIAGGSVCVAAICIGFAFWFGITSRAHLCLSTITIAFVALTSGLRRERFVTIVVGCVSVILTVVFSIEHWQRIPSELRMSDWVSDLRIVLFHLIGVAATSIGVVGFYDRLAKPKKLLMAIPFAGVIVYLLGVISAVWISAYGLVTAEYEHLVQLITLFDGALLFSLVSALHLFKRNWCHAFLAVLSRHVGIQRVIHAATVLNAATVAGLALMLLGTVSNAMSRNELTIFGFTWQKHILTAAGVSSLAAIWGVAAMLTNIVNPASKHRSSFRVITLFSALLFSASSTFVLLISTDRLMNIAIVGWLLPSAIFAAGRTFNSFNIKQIATICTGAWASTFAWWVMKTYIEGIDQVSLACISGIAALTVANIWLDSGRRLKEQYGYFALTVLAFLLPGRFLFIPAISYVIASFSPAAITSALEADFLQDTSIRTVVAFWFLLMALGGVSWRVARSGWKLMGLQIFSAIGLLLLMGLAAAVGPAWAAISTSWCLLVGLIATESIRVTGRHGARLSIGIWHDIFGFTNHLIRSKSGSDEKLLTNFITLVRAGTAIGLLILTGLQTCGLASNLRWQNLCVYYDSASVYQGAGWLDICLRLGPWLAAVTMVWWVGIQAPRRREFAFQVILALGASVAAFAVILQVFLLGKASLVGAAGWLLIGVAGVGGLTAFTTEHLNRIWRFENSQSRSLDVRLTGDTTRDRRMFQAFEILIIFLHVVVFLLSALAVSDLLFGGKWDLASDFSSPILWAGLILSWVFELVAGRQFSEAIRASSKRRALSEIISQVSLNLLAWRLTVFVTFATAALPAFVAAFDNSPIGSFSQVRVLLNGWMIVGALIFVLLAYRRRRLGSRDTNSRRELLAVDLINGVSFLVFICVYLSGAFWPRLFVVFAGWTLIQSMAAGLLFSGWRKLAALPMAVMATNAAILLQNPNANLLKIDNYLWYLILSCVLVSGFESVTALLLVSKSRPESGHSKKTKEHVRWPHLNSFLASVLIGIGGLACLTSGTTVIFGVLSTCISLLLLIIATIDVYLQREQSLTRLHATVFGCTSLLAVTVAENLPAFRELPVLVWLVVMLTTASATAIYLCKRFLPALEHQSLQQSDVWAGWINEESLIFLKSEWRQLSRRLPTLHCVLATASIVVSFWFAVTAGLESIRILSASVSLLAALGIASAALAIDATKVRNVVLQSSVWIAHLSLACCVIAWLPVPAVRLPLSEYWVVASRFGMLMSLMSLFYWWLQPRFGQKFSASSSLNHARLAIDWAIKQKLLERLSWVGVYSAIAAICIAGVNSVVFFDVTRGADLLDRALLVALVSCLAFRLAIAAIKRLGVDYWIPERGRLAAFYGAEFCLVALVGFGYVCFPTLFGGWLRDWWPVAVFALSILAAILGESLKSSSFGLFSSPIVRSSWVLPIIPYAAIWIDREGYYVQQWGDYGTLAVLLATAAVIYGINGWVRNNAVLQALAGGLAVIGYWTLLSGQEYFRFENHPQFWLLPPAVGLLALVEVNRKTLDETVANAVRYFSLLIAYLSSSSEIVLKSFDGQIWPPIILLTLALLGFFGGIAFRIRACLYCGALFTLVALTGMVWHAQQAIDQVWPWWLFGISMGVMIIVGLGVIEKNRALVNQYVDHLRKWER